MITRSVAPSRRRRQTLDDLFQLGRIDRFAPIMEHMPGRIDQIKLRRGAEAELFLQRTGLGDVDIDAHEAGAIGIFLHHSVHDGDQFLAGGSSGSVQHQQLIMTGSQHRLVVESRFNSRRLSHGGCLRRSGRSYGRSSGRGRRARRGADRREDPGCVRRGGGSPSGEGRTAVASLWQLRR